MSAPHYADATVTLWHGDCLDVLATLPDASVDAVVTDPPYGLEFMGREWDGADGFRRSLNPADAGRDNAFGRASRTSPEYRAGHLFGQWCEAWSRECLRVLKPGGHLLAFGGTRTWHRLAVAVEDAGFEIRDGIAWLYGSGFPKSLDVSKAIDKAAGAERPVVGSRPLTGTARIIGGQGSATAGRAAEMYETHATRDTLDLTGPATEDARAWEGWGTALKPAFEPIVVARKPLAGTVAANVLTYGTGALHIDGCRIGDGETRPLVVSDRRSGNEVYGDGLQGSRAVAGGTTGGRWPANVVLDEDQAAALDQQSGTLHAQDPRTRQSKSTAQGVTGFTTQPDSLNYGDMGGASRFFYTAKAPGTERVKLAGTAHPTVKPLSLMRWLVRLVTPPGGIVLEPFAGSGTTVEACILEGFQCVAIEREADYLPLIVQRINRRRDPVAAVRDAGEDGGLFDLLEGGVA